jgi:hypothetical protein
VGVRCEAGSRPESDVWCKAEVRPYSCPMLSCPIGVASCSLTRMPTNDSSGIALSAATDWSKL